MSSKQAEKEYLERTGGAAWEREKPFAPPGSDTLGESLALLHDFTVAVQLLDPGPADRILDLGAGGAWCSDLLQRLNRRAVAVDISHDMLRVGRTRPSRAPIPAAAGDMEHLPFADGTFDKAMCLNALHHVPDIPAAIREVARVLTDTGTAVFSEPGVGHADAVGSVAAVKDFGVLEQEVLIPPFIDACQRAGFRHVWVCPISYAIPDFRLSLDEWRAWQRLAIRKRPIRAGLKLAKAALELIGVGKKSVLFEEAYAIRLVRLFQEPVLTHPFLLATKGEAASDRRPRYGATITIVACPRTVGTRAPIEVHVRAVNTGRLPWRRTTDATPGSVRLGVQLLDPSGKVVVRDFARVDLPDVVGPGSTIELQADLDAPAPGDYRLKFDMLAEGITWFEQAGSTPAVCEITVRATSPGS